MDSNFRAKKWCSPGALWMGKRVGKERERGKRRKEGEEVSKEGVIKEQ